MAFKRCTWYEIVQFFILVFTMSLMFSKHYEFFAEIFSFFYETEFSIISVIVGGFSVLHGIFILFKGVFKVG